MVFLRINKISSFNPATGTHSRYAPVWQQNYLYINPGAKYNGMNVR